MSYGLVICSTCKKEAEQSIRREGQPNAWAHDDGTPLCEGATARYPQVGEPVRCEARVNGIRCERQAIKTLPGSRPWETIWSCGGMHIGESSAPPERRSPFTGRRTGGAGTLRNGLCHCGSGKKRKRCHG